MTFDPLSVAAGIPIGGIITVLIQRHHATWLHWRARRKLIRLTRHGLDALARSAAIFDELHAEWAQAIGPERLRDLEAALRTVTAPDNFRLDAAGWLGGA